MIYSKSLNLLSQAISQGSETSVSGLGGRQGEQSKHDQMLIWQKGDEKRIRELLGPRGWRATACSGPSPMFAEVRAMGAQAEAAGSLSEPWLWGLVDFTVLLQP